MAPSMPPVKVRADHGGLQPPSAYSVISQFEPRRLLKYGTAVAPTPDWTSPSSDHASPRHTPKPGEPSELSRGPTITVSSSAPPPALSSPLKQSLPRALYGYLVAVASRFNLPQEPEEPSDAIVDLNMPELDPSTSDSNFPSSLSLGPLRSNTQNSTTQMEMEEETEAAWKASRQPPPAPVPSSSMPPTRDDPSAVYVNSQILDSQDRRTEGTGVDITSVMTFEEIIPHLNRRGCRNLADEMDPTSYSKNPVNGGGLGDIYKGVLKNGVEVAIKTIRPVYSQDEEIQKHLKRAAREIYTWSKCRHQNVQPLLGLLEFRGQIGMVSVWEKHGNIKNYLRLNPVVDSCQLSVQVAEGLSYLHQLGVVHGDLKGDNILVSGDGIPMLEDFGCSSLREYTLQFTSTIAALGSPRWTAPEVLDGKKASPPADVYALGMTILEMVTGKLPWSELTSTPAVITAVLVKGVRPARPLEVMPQGSQLGEVLWRLLQLCWVSEPSDRPSAVQVGVVMQNITRDGLLEVDVHQEKRSYLIPPELVD